MSASISSAFRSKSRSSASADTAQAARPAPAAATRAATTRSPPLPWPHDTQRWQTAVLGSALVGTWEQRRPFVVQTLSPTQTLIMPRTMAREQQRVAEGLLRIDAMPPRPTLTSAQIDGQIAVLFADATDSEAAQAVRQAAQRSLTIVTGGPGTGKTYSVTRTLALLACQASGHLTIALAAPTGKAAVRMQEAIAENLQSPALQEHLPPSVSAAIAALQATTVHRLLGMRPDGTVRHNRVNPLPYDVVVVDEVSMVDLAQMRRLVEAIADGARLILLGDRDQLSSVEAGTVLADLVTPQSRLAHAVVRFVRSRRFAAAPSIAMVAATLQNAEAAGIADAVAWMCGDRVVAGETDPQRLLWLDRALGSDAGSAAALPADALPADALPADALPASVLPSDRGLASHSALLDGLAEPYRQLLWSTIGADLQQGAQGLAHLATADRQRELLAALERYRVLATHRAGPRGVSGLVKGLEERALRELRRSGGKVPQVDGHWLGRPLLVTRNDPSVGLMNGDVGMVLPTGKQARLAAIFLDRRSGEPQPFAVPLSRLPPHEGALAMTVHKSQGSQFREVALILADGASPIQTRELVYTGLTRAADRLRWSGTRQALQLALERPVARASGLAALLA